MPVANPRIVLAAGSFSEQPSAVWPPWLLTWALLLILASVVGMIPVKTSQATRIVVAMLMGPCLGLAGVGYFVPYSMLVFSLFPISVTLFSAFVLLTCYPTVYSHRFLPWLFAVWVACLPLILSAAAVAYPRPRQASGAVDYIAVTRMLTLSTYAAACIAIALLLRSRIASPRAFATRSSRTCRPAIMEDP